MFGNKITVLLASMAYFFNCENSSSNPLQVASSGFPKAACDSKICSEKSQWSWKLFRPKSSMNEYYTMYSEHWRKLTNEIFTRKAGTKIVCAWTFFSCAFNFKSTLKIIDLVIHSFQQQDKCQFIWSRRDKDGLSHKKTSFFRDLTLFSERIPIYVAPTKPPLFIWCSSSWLDFLGTVSETVYEIQLEENINYWKCRAVGENYKLSLIWYGKCGRQKKMENLTLKCARGEKTCIR